MKRILAFEALIDESKGGLLLKIAALLLEKQIDPETFTWSRPPGGNLVFLRITLRPEEATHALSLRDSLRATPDVVRVTICSLRERKAESNSAGTPKLPEGPFTD